MSESTALSVIRSMDDVERAALAMSKSGYFQDSREQNQAIVKILAGKEMGFGPFASMTGVYIIQGRPSFGANLMAAAVKNSGRYNYRVSELTDAVCEVIFYEGKEEIGRSRFTTDDAKKAGTKNIDKFPRNMLFARAISNGVRWFCPDVFNGAPTYTPEELGAEVDQDGNVIPGQFKIETLAQSMTPPQKAPVVNPAPSGATETEKTSQTALPPTESVEQSTITLEEASAITNSTGVKYGDMPPGVRRAVRDGLKKAIAKESTPELEHKLAAIEMLLSASD